jgi:hypothetical protein
LTYLLSSHYVWAGCTDLDISFKGKKFTCTSVTLKGKSLTFNGEENRGIEITMVDKSTRPFSDFEYDTRNADNHWQDIPHLFLHFREGNTHISESHSNDFELEIYIDEVTSGQYKVDITLIFPEDGGSSVKGEFVTDKEKSQLATSAVPAELAKKLCVLAREEKEELSQCQDVSCLDGVVRKYSSANRQRTVLNLPQSAKEGMLNSVKTLQKYFTSEGRAKSGCEASWTDDKVLVYPFYRDRDGGVPRTKFVNENGSWKVSL